MSLYHGASARLNFGPNFAFPVAGAKPFTELAKEKWGKIVNSRKNFENQKKILHDYVNELNKKLLQQVPQTSNEVKANNDGIVVEPFNLNDPKAEKQIDVKEEATAQCIASAPHQASAQEQPQQIMLKMEVRQTEPLKH